jgi:hypothetical protein
VLPDHLSERHQAGLIPWEQAGRHHPAGCPQLPELLGGQAGTHVERHHHVDRDLIETDQLDVLADPVVLEFEVGWCEPLHRAQFVRDEHIDPDGLDLAGEGHLLRHGRRRARKKRNDSAEDNGPTGHHERGSNRVRSQTSSINTSGSSACHSKYVHHGSVLRPSAPRDKASCR